MPMPSPQARFTTTLATVFLGVLALASCSSAPPPADASCLDKQNYCLDRCNSAHSSTQLANAIGLALARPKTDADRQRAAQLQQQSEVQADQKRDQCREGCDTRAEMCRRRM